MPDNPDIIELPEFEQQQTHKLARNHPLASLCSLTLALVLAASLLLICVTVIPNLQEIRVSVGVIWALPLVLLLYAWVWLSCAVRSYGLRREDISYYSGVMLRSVVIQPIGRLQHIEITRGVIERLFGLATLKLYSAGGASYALAIPGLHYHLAQALREQITASKSLKNAQ